MPRRLSPRRVAALRRELIEIGPLTSKSILLTLAANYRCHLSTVYRHQSQLHLCRPPQQYSGGPRKIVTWKMEQAVHALLEERPWYYQDEIQAFLLDAFDVDISVRSVSNLLSRLKITRKKLRVEAAQRSAELRTDWKYHLQFFTADQIICVDESGSDERDGDRTYGWAVRGAKATVRRWLQSKPRVSVLAGYTAEGYRAARTFKGTCTGDIFEDFVIDELLPHCTAYPGPRSVIVLDNASVHHANKLNIQRACDAAGVMLRFLPPYSPDFNPIEESFNDLKAFIRRHYRRERRNHDDYQSFLEWAVLKSGTGTEARRRAGAHFRNAGIR